MDVGVTAVMAAAIKPLVFISASQRDSDWRDRLKAALESDSRTEWWDDSRINAGDRWADVTRDVLASASVAVVLLSPEYLGSDSARSELTAIAARATQSKAFGLFAILVHDCAWQTVDELRNREIWTGHKPLDSLTERELQVELQADRRQHRAQRRRVCIDESAADSCAAGDFARVREPFTGPQFHGHSRFPVFAECRTGRRARARTCRKERPCRRDHQLPSLRLDRERGQGAHAQRHAVVHTSGDPTDRQVQRGAQRVHDGRHDCRRETGASA